MRDRLRNGLHSGAAVVFCLLLPFAAAAQQAETKSEPAATEEAKTESDAEKPEAANAQTDDQAALRDLEEKVNELKEKIFRSKARLMLLRETVLNGAIAGAKAVVIHKNEMGSNFLLERATYSLDGAPIFSKENTEDDELADAEQIELFNGSIIPGNHNISVHLVFRGNGFGVFSYLEGYKFNIKSSYAFTAEEGKLTTVRVVAYEKGGITTDLRDRPAVRYDVEVKQDAQVPPSVGKQKPAQAE